MIIAEDKRVVTLANVFTVAPENQQKLLELFSRIMREDYAHLPGFISTALHKSSDGVRVIVYVQWRSKEDLEAMQQRPVFSSYAEEVKKLNASSDAHLYEVFEVVSHA
jgi:heme-degrading monooxygenase HmoA